MRRRNFLFVFGFLAAIPLASLGFVLAAGPGIATVAASLGAAYLVLFPVAALASTGLRRHAAEHEHLSQHDVLTGIPNRMLFTRRLGELLARSEAVGVIVADVDRFKDVNDRLGHCSGDEVLRLTAERLGASLRTSDTVARLGGDEFGILLAGADLAVARQVARRIADALEVPLAIGTGRTQVSVSLGIACSPEHGTDYDVLLQAADFAMYEAKQAGGGFRVAERALEKPKAPGQAIGGLRPVHRAAPAKGA